MWLIFNAILCGFVAFVIGLVLLGLYCLWLAIVGDNKEKDDESNSEVS